MNKFKAAAFGFLFFLLIIAGFFLGTKIGGSKYPYRVKEVSAKELNENLVDKNFTLINVHTPYDGEIARTDFFVNYDNILANKDLLPEDKNAPIVLYCLSGRMSKEALGDLNEMGYKNISHLKGGMVAWKGQGFELQNLSNLSDDVTPAEGYVLPISWGDVGPRLVSLGVINLPEFEKVMNLTDEQRKILTRGSSDPITIGSENSRFVVNVLWALGLAQKSAIYEEGPMGREYKDEVGNFASTGGWNLAKGEAINYLNKYDLISLNSEQQSRIYDIASNIYRPCCGNNTAFPDCNHGMAALGALELMVSQNLSDDEIYENILKLNSFWFPQNYLATATYFARQGTSWQDVDAKLVLGDSFSSAKGAGEIYKKVGPVPYGEERGGSCGA